MKHIVLTGGGTAGHVTPNIALLPALKNAGFKISYIGSYNGIEKELINELNVPYYGISSGKLRRYLSLENISDIARVLKGIGEAKKLLAKLKPDIIFSKGGFVAVPVVRAAKALKIPVVIHESDMTPGLANKLSFSAASAVCCNFPETLDSLPKNKALLTGTPIRSALMQGSADAALEFCGLNKDKPVLLVMGGSLGAATLNDAVRRTLPLLLENFQIIHLCGKGKVNPSFLNVDGYVQYEYIKKELADMFALASIVISRAGANSISELCALAKPNVLVPLSTRASRGDQILNARSFEKQGFSLVIEEDDLTETLLNEAVLSVYENRQKYIDAMSSSPSTNAIDLIVKTIKNFC